MDNQRSFIDQLEGCFGDFTHLKVSEIAAVLNLCMTFTPRLEFSHNKFKTGNINVELNLLDEQTKNYMYITYRTLCGVPVLSFTHWVKDVIVEEHTVTINEQHLDLTTNLKAWLEKMCKHLDSNSVV